jgi:hypothetical protein
MRLQILLISKLIVQYMLLVILSILKRMQHIQFWLTTVNVFTAESAYSTWLMPPMYLAQNAFNSGKYRYYFWQVTDANYLRSKLL